MTYHLLKTGCRAPGSKETMNARTYICRFGLCPKIQAIGFEIGLCLTADRYPKQGVDLMALHTASGRGIKITNT